ncbi:MULTISPECIES: hypothetical protein [Chelativorans]|jgi:hypothetical protein|uniref:DUF883 domain-containing protein n=1 Tax=Chelativorans sp. (strain BNC1) TaxID=266779 RepID=Q11D18_CHESB|nr:MULTISPECIES: hypothetical protein [Chelativorans]
MRHRHEDLGEDLRDQIASLSHEIAAMKKQMMRRGRGSFRDSRHMSEEIVETVRDYLSAAMPDIRRGAYQIQDRAREHPGTTAAVAAASVIVLGLAASLFMRR